MIYTFAICSSTHYESSFSALVTHWYIHSAYRSPGSQQMFFKCLFNGYTHTEHVCIWISAKSKVLKYPLDSFSFWIHAKQQNNLDLLFHITLVTYMQENYYYYILVIQFYESDKCRESCNHHHNWDRDQFHHHKRVLPATLLESTCPQFLSTGIHWSVLSPYSFAFLKCHINGVTLSAVFKSGSFA